MGLMVVNGLLTSQCNYFQDSTTICKVAVKILYTDDDKEQKRAVGSCLDLNSFTHIFMEFCHFSVAF